MFPAAGWPVALAVALLAGCATPVPTPGPPDSLPAPAAEPVVEVTPVPSAEDLAAERQARLACERISIAAVGDIMLGTDYPETRLPADDGRGQLSAASAVLKAADVAFGNVEGVLMDGGEAVKVCKDPSACYLFRSPARYARTLADAGFTVVSLANNHARDFGEEGRGASMRALDDAGVRHSGRQGDIASWTQGELRLAMIAFSPFSGSWPMLDEVAATTAVRELAASHDVVIVSFHGGGEGAEAQRIPFTIERYYGENRGDVVQFAHSMIDAGADLVIGHGPHVPRAMELYRGRLAAYSLGNFATWYGISVADAKGYAPILTAELDGNGELVTGAVVSMQQQRPDGPRPDATQQAWRMIQRLTALDFPEGKLELADSGEFRPGFRPAASCETP